MLGLVWVVVLLAVGCANVAPSGSKPTVVRQFKSQTPQTIDRSEHHPPKGDDSGAPFSIIVEEKPNQRIRIPKQDTSPSNEAAPMDPLSPSKKEEPPSPVPSPPPISAPTPDFKRGASFDPSLLGASQMIKALIQSQNYMEAKTPKAIAINQSGLGMVMIHSNDATQGDVERSALEACYVVGGQEPCVLLASGDKFSIDKAHLRDPGSYSFSLMTPRSLSEAPFVASTVLNSLVASYTQSQETKAFVVSLDGTALAVMDPQLVDQAEAERLALERCEMVAKMLPCLLVASGQTIVFNSKMSGWELIGKYQVEQLSENSQLIPGLSSDMLASLDNYQDRVEDDGAGIVYLSPLIGQLNWATPSRNVIEGKDYKTSAREQCETLAGPGNCLVLFNALKFEVPVTKLGPYSKGFEVAHCQAMPRISCDAHKRAGCTVSGSYYLIEANGKVSAKSCVM